MNNQKINFAKNFIELCAKGDISKEVEEEFNFINAGSYVEFASNELLEEGLSIACKEGNLNAVKLLIETDLISNAGYGKALNRACENNKIEIVEFLLFSEETKNKIKSDIFKYGALVLVCQNGNLDMANLLIKKNDGIAVKLDVDCHGFNLALKNKHYDVAKKIFAEIKKNKDCYENLLNKYFITDLIKKIGKEYNKDDVEILEFLKPLMAKTNTGYLLLSKIYDENLEEYFKKAQEIKCFSKKDIGVFQHENNQMILTFGINKFKIKKQMETFGCIFSEKNKELLLSAFIRYYQSLGDMLFDECINCLIFDLKMEYPKNGEKDLLIDFVKILPENDRKNILLNIKNKFHLRELKNKIENELDFNNKKELIKKI